MTTFYVYSKVCQIIRAYLVLQNLAQQNGISAPAEMVQEDIGSDHPEAKKATPAFALAPESEILQ